MVPGRAAGAGVESGAEGRLVVGQFHPDAASHAVSSGKRQDEEASALPLRVGVLGPVTVWRDGREVTAGQPRQLAVLGVLASRANRVVSRGELVDAVWGDQPPVSVDSGIYTYVAGLRRVLEPDRLRLSPDALDANQFEESLARSRELRAAGDLRGAAQVVDEGLALWRGQPF